MELHPSNDNGYTDSKSPHNTEIEVLSEADRDVQALARLGKKPILKGSDIRRAVPLGQYARTGLLQEVPQLYHGYGIRQRHQGV
ncbi:MAG: hypothetical protein L6R39_002248 [Caloplaca ligustica]|nr:MAG: hypothetical protein L6R39_002248 [Caloplaca ligustica]